MKHFLILSFVLLISIFGGTAYAVYCVHRTLGCIDSQPCVSVGSCGGGGGWQGYGSYVACEGAGNVSPCY